jgi:ATP-dependent Clp protease ATP-binding subunit ClpA
MAAQLFERFGDSAHLAVVLADREARAMGHPLVDLEHLLLGALVADPNVAAAMVDSGLDPVRLRAQIVVARGADAPLGRGESSFTAEARQALRAVSMFARRKDRPVTCSDIVFELLSTKEGQLWHLLGRMGVDPHRQRLLLASSTGSRAVPGPALAHKGRLPGRLTSGDPSRAATPRP